MTHSDLVTRQDRASSYYLKNRYCDTGYDHLPEASLTSWVQTRQFSCVELNFIRPETLLSQWAPLCVALNYRLKKLTPILGNVSYHPWPFLQKYIQLHSLTVLFSIFVSIQPKCVSVLFSIYIYVYKDSINLALYWSYICKLEYVLTFSCRFINEM